MIVGTAQEYLQSLEPATRKVVGTTLLRLLAGQRAANMENGEALKVLALLERDTLLVMSNMRPDKTTVWLPEIPKL